MPHNYIFSGLGHAFGEHQVSNQELEQAIEKGYLKNFNGSRIQQSDNYKAALLKEPDLTPFRYMAEHKMGFKTRCHVVPFPPSKAQYATAKNALDLAVEAVQMAIDDSGIHAEDVSAWLVSTATPHEQAPGLAETLKAYFVNFENQTETMSLTSACGGFNYNLERGIDYLKTHVQAQHVVICHTEVMSELLIETTEFVPFVTFADAAAAVILSKVASTKREGVIAIVNYEDPQMINFLGATSKGRMYMQANIIKTRATENLIRNSKEVLKLSQWDIDELDHIVPHQTGHAIVHGVVEALELPMKKVFQEIQYEKGNLSGASIPAAMSCLLQSKRLQVGDKILTATAGLGGENGAFTYIVPQKTQQSHTILSLKDKICVVTGASGEIGQAVAKEAASRGARLVLQYRTPNEKFTQFVEWLKLEYQTEADAYLCDFSQANEVEKWTQTMVAHYPEIHYLVHTAATTGSLKRATEVGLKEFKMVSQINEWAPIFITKKLFPLLKETILYVGSVAEDAEFSGSSAYVASKRALHGFAGSFAPLAQKSGVRSIYYMPGIVNGGMAKYLSDDQKTASMMAIGQKTATPLELIAQRMVSSLYIPKVQGTHSSYEDLLTVRRDSYHGDNIHYSIL